MSLDGRVLMDDQTPSPKHNHTNVLSRRQISYIKREEIVHASDSTFREALRFSLDCRLLDRAPPSVKEHRIRLWLQAFSLEALADKRIATAEEQSIRLLSIAMETISGHNLVLGNDVTNGLDDAMCRQMLSNLRDMCDSKTMAFMGTLQHPNDDYLQYFDHVLMLIDGRVIHDPSVIQMPSIIHPLYKVPS
jgi:ABC-type multidrug transport system ATPase subunit